jgi:hypothetical protein
MQDQDDFYESFVAGVNALAAASTRDLPVHREEKDISLADLGDILSQIQRELENVETKRKLREKQWDEEEKDEQVLCSNRGVDIVYKGPHMYTYQDTMGGHRVVVSICSRCHTYCTQCGDTSVKLRGGVCRACDVGTC